MHVGQPGAGSQEAHHRRTLSRSALPVSPQAALLRLAGTVAMSSADTKFGGGSVWPRQILGRTGCWHFVQRPAAADDRAPKGKRVVRRGGCPTSCRAWAWSSSEGHGVGCSLYALHPVSPPGKQGECPGWAGGGFRNHGSLRSVGNVGRSRLSSLHPALAVSSLAPWGAAMWHFQWDGCCAPGSLQLWQPSQL